MYICAAIMSGVAIFRYGSVCVCARKLSVPFLQKADGLYSFPSNLLRRSSPPGAFPSSSSPPPRLMLDQASSSGPHSAGELARLSGIRPSSVVSSW